MEIDDTLKRYASVSCLVLHCIYALVSQSNQVRRHSSTFVMKKVFTKVIILLDNIETSCFTVCQITFNISSHNCMIMHYHAAAYDCDGYTCVMRS